MWNARPFRRGERVRANFQGQGQWVGAVVVGTFVGNVVNVGDSVVGAALGLAVRSAKVASSQKLGSTAVAAKETCAAHVIHPVRTQRDAARMHR